MTKIVRRKSVAGDPPSPSPAPAPAPAAAPAPAPTPESRRRPLVPPRAPSSSKTRNKVLMTVLDGKIEWATMSSESRKAFEEMFRDPEFLKQFGLSGKENFDPEQMKAIFDGLSMAYQTVAGLVLRWPSAASALLAYSDEQKEMLAKPTAKLADRLAPKLIRDNQELIIFFALFSAITQKNFLAGMKEVEKIQKQKLPPAPGAGAGPGPVRVQRPPSPAPPPAPAPAEMPAPQFHVPFSPPSSFEGESLG